MDYRYNGVHLNTLTEKIKNITSVELVARDGSKISIPVAELGNYFVAYNRTQLRAAPIYRRENGSQSLILTLG